MALIKLTNVYFLGSLIRNVKGIYNKLNETIDYINGTVLPYKSYVALIEQTGTDAPTVTVLQNTLGQDLTWEYDAVGSYYANFESDITKTYCMINTPNFSLANTNRDSNISSDGTAFYIMVSQGDTRTNGLLYNTAIEIRIYN